MRTVEVTDDLQAYLNELVAPRDPVLARMEEEAHRENIPIVDVHEGALLSLLVKIARAKRVLELGTATGYSGIWLLRATSGGTLTTFETNHERAQNQNDPRRARCGIQGNQPRRAKRVENQRALAPQLVRR